MALIVFTFSALCLKWSVTLPTANFVRGLFNKLNIINNYLLKILMLSNILQELNKLNIQVSFIPNILYFLFFNNSLPSSA